MRGLFILLYHIALVTAFVLNRKQDLDDDTVLDTLNRDLDSLPGEPWIGPEGDRKWDSEWLSDFEQRAANTSQDGSHVALDTSLLGDAPAPADLASLACPRAVDATKASCARPQCVADSECAQPAESCCFNGCVRTCTQVAYTGPLIDWELQPQPRNPGSLSWLLEQDPDSTSGGCMRGGESISDGRVFTHAGKTCKCIKSTIICGAFREEGM